MSSWYLYNDAGKATENQYTEGDVRLQLQNASDDHYAMNETGDVIETFDGPINVARQQDK